MRSLKETITYITNKEKTSPELIGALNCSAEPKMAYEEMVLCKQAYDKATEDGDSEINGVGTARIDKGNAQFWVIDG